MNTYRKNAILAGVLFILCTATSIIGGLMGNGLVEGSNYLSTLACSGNKAIIATIFEVIWAGTGAAIAFTLYPVIKKNNESLAMGSVIFRAIEGVFVVAGTLALLALFTLSQETLQTGAAGTLFVGMRHWSAGVLAIFFFNTGAMLYYIAMYRSGVIPRWLARWGIVGTVLGLAAVVIGAFSPEFVNSPVHFMMNMPIAFQEMFLAVWLIVKGFEKKGLAALPAPAM